MKIFQGKDAIYYVVGCVGLRYGIMVHRWGDSVGGWFGLLKIGSCGVGVHLHDFTPH